ncbi:MAG: DeoR/GlpR transcriptional regulator [bacterium]|nr:DeoR/GlpR transcriptional regulator [bacterium]
MDSENLIDKIYGGATLRHSMHRVIPVSMRKDLNVEGKNRIALKCLSLINDGDTIFLDGSTTALQIASEMKSINNLIVITNSLETAERAADIKNIKIIGIGGTLRSSTRTFTGQQAVKSIHGYFADKAFICCDGVDMETGITDANEEEAEVRKAMLNHSRIKILVSDHTKINKTSFVGISDFRMIDVIVSDKELSSDWLDFFRIMSVKPYIANE